MFAWSWWYGTLKIIGINIVSTNHTNCDNKSQIRTSQLPSFIQFIVSWTCVRNISITRTFLARYHLDSDTFHRKPLGVPIWLDFCISHSRDLKPHSQFFFPRVIDTFENKRSYEKGNSLSRQSYSTSWLFYYPALVQPNVEKLSRDISPKLCFLISKLNVLGIVI